MAHWSTGYADFHEEIWAPPPEPAQPLQLPCAECDATFTDLYELREHVFTTHPIARPVLGYRGMVCGDARLLVQRRTVPGDWTVSHCTGVRIDGAEVEPAELGTRLSTARGIVVVQISNARSNRVHEFDFSIPSEQDLRGVEAAVEDLLDRGVITAGSISAFYDRAQSFDSARNYAGGIAEYLYWLSGRGAGVDATTAARHREKLNRAAQLLGDLHRPVACAITSVISFHFNHFDEAAHRALSPRLGAIAGRLGRMWAAQTAPADQLAIGGELAHLEQLLMDDYTAAVVELCGEPLDAATSDHVANFDYRGADRYDQIKAVLFVAEHHLATGDPRAGGAVRAASQNGFPEQWVDSRLDLTTNKGAMWHAATAETATTPSPPRPETPPAVAPTRVTRTATAQAIRRRNNSEARSEPMSLSSENREPTAAPGQASPATGRRNDSWATAAATTSSPPVLADTTSMTPATGLGGAMETHPANKTQEMTRTTHTRRKHRLADATPTPVPTTAQRRVPNEITTTTSQSSAENWTPRTSDTPPWKTRDEMPAESPNEVDAAPTQGAATSKHWWRDLFAKRRR
ncbi:hypothetical protein [Nocardia sp. AG03]|uniref:hypothetical protein n=1 Tax=Nocardia sp. AG03 TaxID=3025312 RepID=UPI002418467B|nr:hypothetical protein [Nocardia sp. AG03]